jgi:hypothetical protein
LTWCSWRAGHALGLALGDRRILMVVDDVWREQDLRPFMQGGTGERVCVRVIRPYPVTERRR